jgi:hypothetical protein
MNLSDFQPWQTFISGTLGFTGVICAMIYNARCARQLAMNVRRQEAISLCVALQQELISYRDYVDSVLENIRQLPGIKGFTAGVRPVVTRQVLDANLEKVGLLKPDQVAAVLTAYSLQGELLRRLKMVGGWNSDDQDEITVGGENFQPLIVILEMHSAAADKAVRSLGPPASWSSPLRKEPGGIGFMGAEAAEGLGLVADPVTGKLGWKK